MAVGPFLTHDTGYASLVGSGDWVNDAYYAVLATTGEAPDRATHVDYEDILNECADGDYDQVALTGKAVTSETGGEVQFTCDEISFGASVSITARYLFILKGTAASPANADEILGHIDLDGAGNISSVAAEFSFTPDATNGLFEVARSAAP
jgi:hypothetical protein